MPSRYTRYTQEQKEFLIATVPNHANAETTRLFNERFGTDRTISQIKDFSNRYRCDIKRKIEGFKYTQEQKNFLIDNVKGRPHAQLAEMFNERFNQRLTTAQISTFLRNRKLTNGLARAPIGAEQRNNRCRVKIAQPGTWRPKHLAIWEQANGPLPKWHSVIFADGDRTNFSLDNLLLVTNREALLMCKLKLRKKDAQLTKLGHEIAKLHLAILDRKKEGDGHA